MKSEFSGPVNIGSEERVTINEMAAMIMGIAGKKLVIKHVPGPMGVRGRNSDNALMRAKLGWEPVLRLEQGLAAPYPWFEGQVRAARASKAEAPAVAVTSSNLPVQSPEASHPAT